MLSCGCCRCTCGRVLDESGITSESRGYVTCDSLGDVTRTHGTHDVKRSVGKVRRIWMRKQHQEGQNCIVMSTRGFLLSVKTALSCVRGVFYYCGFE